jgi:hypothetical protein
MERLLPAFSVELRSKLLSEARDAVLHSVSDRLWEWASQAPHQVSSVEPESEARVVSEHSMEQVFLLTEWVCRIFTAVSRPPHMQTVSVSIANNLECA